MRIIWLILSIYRYINAQSELMSSPAITPDVVAHVHDIIEDILTGITQNEPPAKKESLASDSPGNNNLEDRKNQSCEGQTLHDPLHYKSAAIKSQIGVHNTEVGQEQNSETGNSKSREEGQENSFLPTASVGEEQGTDALLPNPRPATLSTDNSELIVSNEHSEIVEEKDDFTDDVEGSEDLSLEGKQNVDLHIAPVEPGDSSDITRSNTRKETSEDNHKTVQSSQKRFNIDLVELFKENRLLAIIIMSTIS